MFRAIIVIAVTIHEKVKHQQETGVSLLSEFPRTNEKATVRKTSEFKKQCSREPSLLFQ
ncbi:hypothetical protein [Nostoc sp. TCL26-01]|uniref:hypothetical protein n=1 Tax=Nostoc sp. TCL26-01 TaxID=2576904 RepID=UPI0015BC8F77|nr:hypothetical protein [Nostoc sp. TCL26-01]